MREMWTPPVLIALVFLIANVQIIVNAEIANNESEAKNWNTFAAASREKALEAISSMSKISPQIFDVRMQRANPSAANKDELRKKLQLLTDSLREETKVLTKIITKAFMNKVNMTPERKSQITEKMKVMSSQLRTVSDQQHEIVENIAKSQRPTEDQLKEVELGYGRYVQSYQEYMRALTQPIEIAAQEATQPKAESTSKAEKAASEATQPKAESTPKAVSKPLNAPVSTAKLIAAQLRVKSKIDMIRGSVANILQLGEDYVKQAKTRPVDQGSITAISALLADARTLLNDIAKKGIVMSVATSSDKSNEAKMAIIKEVENVIDEKTNSVQKEIFDPIKKLLAKANANPDFGDDKIAKILHRLKKSMEDICEENLKEQIKQDVSDLEKEIRECHEAEKDEEQEVEEKIEEEEEKVEEKKEEIDKTEEEVEEEIEEKEEEVPSTEATGEEVTKSPEEVKDEVTELTEDSEDMVDKVDDVAEKCPEK